MPKIKRETLAKVFPNQEAIVAVEQTFRKVDEMTAAGLPPPATDLASAIALLNAIRARLAG